MSYFPSWLRKKPPPLIGKSLKVWQILRRLELNTVCQSAKCPNLKECFASGTATFMIMGQNCTRACRFCAVSHQAPQPLDETEPERIARAIKELNLRYAVITSVTRDDLTDGGADHFARTIRTIRRFSPNTLIEVLTPDFHGRIDSIKSVLAARPNAFGHNLETVPRLYARIRPQADYQKSLDVLDCAKRYLPGVVTKSGLLLGLGEEWTEVRAVLKDLRRINCDLVTLGQYLRPSLANHNLPVTRFVSEEEFKEYKRQALALGFKSAASGPYVRSSYQASTLFSTSKM